MALVVGNGAYVHLTKLANPGNDAKDIADKLSAVGFDVIGGIDLDQAALIRALRRFERATRQADVVVLYYAGHGIQLGNENYIAPVDAEITTEGDVYLTLISLSSALKQINEKVRTRIILLDACRNNPFGNSISERSVVRFRQGLGEIKSPSGYFIAYATAPDATADDGQGRNSPFTAGLLKNIAVPGSSISDLMIKVRSDVRAATGNRQVPWETSSLLDPFYFVSQPSSVSAGAAKAPRLRPLRLDVAEKFETARTIGSATAWKAFITEFLNDESAAFYLTIARSELLKLPGFNEAAELAEEREEIALQFDKAQFLDNELGWNAFLLTFGESEPEHVLVEIARARLEQVRSRRKVEQFAILREVEPVQTAAFRPRRETSKTGAGATVTAASNSDRELRNERLAWPVSLASAKVKRVPNGIELEVPPKTDVTSADGGVVIYAGDGLKEYGSTVLIRHKSRLVTVYANLSKMLVTRGQEVRRGQRIGATPILQDEKKFHFEVRIDSTPRDPLEFLYAVPPEIALSSPVMAMPFPIIEPDRIRRIQEALRAFGHTDLQIDGRAGRKTTDAIREFQSLMGLPATGQPNEALETKMREIGLIRG